MARNQGINRVEEIDEDYYILEDFFGDDYGEATTYIHKSKIKEEVLKHSPNIIDLIEVGDYVNGYLIMENEGKLPSDGRTCFVVFKRCEHNYMKVWDEQDIKDIVTHEQFDSMKYIVGGKEK